MKFTSIILYLLPLTVFSQKNLLKNPSFEIIDSAYLKKQIKPYARSLKNWETTNISPDLFSDSIALNPPFYKGFKGRLTFGNKNFAGQQTPKGGDYFIGLYQYAELDGKMVKNCLATESIAGELKSPLIKGLTYSITAFVSLSEISNSSVNEIKFNFSDSARNVSGTNIWCKIRIDTTNSFKLYNIDSSWINSKEKWIQIKGTYTASGGEKYLNIGIPKSNPKLRPEKVKWKYKIFKKYKTNLSTVTICYYYFDEISVVQSKLENYFDE